ncbi:hypothetical protein HFN63_09630 [Rhizobium leguminosarum]|nr:hypothetical protein [Rhizobium leguminosarum]
MVPAAQSRACFRRHRACGHRPACSDCGAVIPRAADRPAARASHSHPRQSLPGRSMLGGSPGRCIRTGAITPLLGGVGPLTVMSLLHNTLIAASMRSGLGVPLLR